MNSKLVIDVGNTSTTLGLYANGKISRVRHMPSDSPQVELSAERAVIASVRPSVNARWKRALKSAGAGDQLWVSHKLDFGVPVSYPKPEMIGTDRLANACAAAAEYGMPVVVCDFGTALTFDIVKKREGYVGGIICPGLPLMFDYLAEKTALLPHIKPLKTKQVVGKNTKAAMQIGARLGYRGMVRETLAELKKELGRGMKVCATGGFANWVLDGLDDTIPVDKNLTLKGLGRIGELNQ